MNVNNQISAIHLSDIANEQHETRDFQRYQQQIEKDHERGHYLLTNLVGHLLDAGMREKAVKAVIGNRARQHAQLKFLRSFEQHISELATLIENFQDPLDNKAKIQLTGVYSAQHALKERIKVITEKDLITLIELGELDLVISILVLITDKKKRQRIYLKLLDIANQDTPQYSRLVELVSFEINNLTTPKQLLDISLTIHKYNIKIADMAAKRAFELVARKQKMNERVELLQTLCEQTHLPQAVYQHEVQALFDDLRDLNTKNQYTSYILRLMPLLELNETDHEKLFQELLRKSTLSKTQGQLPSIVRVLRHFETYPRDTLEKIHKRLAQIWSYDLNTTDAETHLTYGELNRIERTLKVVQLFREVNEPLRDDYLTRTLNLISRIPNGTRIRGRNSIPKAHENIFAELLIELAFAESEALPSLVQRIYSFTGVAVRIREDVLEKISSASLQTIMSNLGYTTLYDSVMRLKKSIMLVMIERDTSETVLLQMLAYIESLRQKLELLVLIIAKLGVTDSLIAELTSYIEAHNPENDKFNSRFVWDAVEKLTIALLKQGRQDVVDNIVNVCQPDERTKVRKIKALNKRLQSPTSHSHPEEHDSFISSFMRAYWQLNDAHNNEEYTQKEPFAYYFQGLQVAIKHNDVTLFNQAFNRLPNIRKDPDKHAMQLLTLMCHQNTPITQKLLANTIDDTLKHSQQQGGNTYTIYSLVAIAEQLMQSDKSRAIALIEQAITIAENDVSKIGLSTIHEICDFTRKHQLANLTQRFVELSALRKQIVENDKIKRLNQLGFGLDSVNTTQEIRRVKRSQHDGFTDKRVLAFASLLSEVNKVAAANLYSYLLERSASNSGLYDRATLLCTIAKARHEANLPYEPSLLEEALTCLEKLPQTSRYDRAFTTIPLIAKNICETADTCQQKDVLLKGLRLFGQIIGTFQQSLSTKLKDDPTLATRTLLSNELKRYVYSLRTMLNLLSTYHQLSDEEKNNMLDEIVATIHIEKGRNLASEIDIARLYDKYAPEPALDHLRNIVTAVTQQEGNPDISEVVRLDEFVELLFKYQMLDELLQIIEHYKGYVTSSKKLASIPAVMYENGHHDYAQQAYDALYVRNIYTYRQGYSLRESYQRVIGQQQWMEKYQKNSSANSVMTTLTAPFKTIFRWFLAVTFYMMDLQREYAKERDGKRTQNNENLERQTTIATINVNILHTMERYDDCRKIIDSIVKSHENQPDVQRQYIPVGVISSMIQTLNHTGYDNANKRLKQLYAERLPVAKTEPTQPKQWSESLASKNNNILNSFLETILNAKNDDILDSRVTSNMLIEVVRVIAPVREDCYEIFQLFNEYHYE